MAQQAGAATIGSPAEPAADALWRVEQYGLDIIPERDRHGGPFELFWVWMGANIILTYIISGSVLIFFGLSLWEATVAIVLGNLLYVLVGLGGIPGPRAGTATMAISRAGFGLRGNLAPTFLSWLNVVGWQAVNLVLGAFALFALAEEIGITVNTASKAVMLSLLTVVTYVVAILGHATIVFLQKLFTVALGLLMIGVLIQTIPETKWSFSGGELAASNKLATFMLGVILVAALPLSWVNYPADYSRYFPRSTSGTKITAWTFVGAFIPAVVISFVGAIAATAADLTDPVGGLKPLLESWYFIPFLIVVIGGSITNNFLNTYSSGMALLALGVRLKRWKTIPVDGVLATAASVYAIFFHDFTATFIEFLSLMIIWIAPWCAVYLVDAWLRRVRYESEDLLLIRGGRYWYRAGFNVEGVIAWVLGMVAAAAFTNSTRWQSPLSTDVLGGADLSIIAGLLVAGGVYYALRTRRLEEPEMGARLAGADRP
jgi:nucleobase:cation symporter-1, NCS1 family